MRGNQPQTLTLYGRKRMTTSVKVEAHCSTDTEVKIAVKEGDDVLETTTIQDGETAEKYVFDGREITVKEVKKDAPAN